MLACHDVAGNGKQPERIQALNYLVIMWQEPAESRELAKEPNDSEGAL